MAVVIGDIVVGIREVFGEKYPALNSLVGYKYKDKQKILKYLRSAFVESACAGWYTDVKTGEKIPEKAVCYTDGKYWWRSDIPYYVERYNMKLPDDFIAHIETHMQGAAE